MMMEKLFDINFRIFFGINLFSNGMRVNVGGKRDKKVNKSENRKDEILRENHSLWRYSAGRSTIFARTGFK